MNALIESQILALWEAGRDCHPIDRGLRALAVAMPDVDVASRPVGWRNLALLRLRQATFGPQLAACADCPACGAAMAFDLDVAALLETVSAPPERASDEPMFDAHGAAWRLPSSRDQAKAAMAADSDTALAQLLRACRVGAPPDASLPQGAALDDIEARMEALDPAANIELSLRCADCAQAWDDISLCARGLLRDVHRLARAYGWTEPQVLALGPARRAAYLELADSEALP
ncbi:hypothetical protein [Achromobacter animicus]|uniref:hypothetical protein n=2 Tax=Achromobacter TaxID=222 RepID=UPI0028AF469E|nr:hypothetical protein [Achromobacter animicus]